jgi:hypothetical protein
MPLDALHRVVPLGCWGIDWLLVVLAHFPADQVSVLVSRLKSQREKSNWGEPGTTTNFTLL